MQKQLKGFWALFVLAGSFVLGSPLAFCAETYQIDAVHSRIGFAVKHMMVSTTKGEFTDYQGTITYDPDDLKASTADIVVKTPSINTRNEKRDEHLKSADFLEVEKFPEITFKNVKFVKQGDGIAMTGDLTIKNVTKTTTLFGQVSGPVKSPMGGTVIGIEADGAINRQDFGVSFNKQMDNGGLLVDDVVLIQVSIEADKK